MTSEIVVAKMGGTIEFNTVYAKWGSRQKTLHRDGYDAAHQGGVRPRWNRQSFGRDRTSSREKRMDTARTWSPIAVFPRFQPWFDRRIIPLVWLPQAQQCVNLHVFATPWRHAISVGSFAGVIADIDREIRGRNRHRHPAQRIDGEAAVKRIVVYDV